MRASPHWVVVRMGLARSIVGERDGRRDRLCGYLAVCRGGCHCTPKQNGLPDLFRSLCFSSSYNLLHGLDQD